MASEEQIAEPRIGTLERNTSETQISVTINTDGQGGHEADTGHDSPHTMIYQSNRHA